MHGFCGDVLDLELFIFLVPCFKASTQDPDWVTDKIHIYQLCNIKYIIGKYVFVISRVLV